jgi:hypothetical protein
LRSESELIPVQSAPVGNARVTALNAHILLIDGTLLNGITRLKAGRGPNAVELLIDGTGVKGVTALNAVRDPKLDEQILIYSFAQNFRFLINLPNQSTTFILLQ